VVIGASFIGLEAAAALRERGLAVDVVAPEARPLERVMGAAVGDAVRRWHEDHGVRFHLGRTPARVDADAVTLDDGTRFPADVVVMGVGVRPDIALAERRGSRRTVACW
jgi:3-phenylpropionate/trans-cinnamate dioxygenase ferredoxin reductase subunit